MAEFSGVTASVERAVGSGAETEERGIQRGDGSGPHVEPEERNAAEDGPAGVDESVGEGARDIGPRLEPRELRGDGARKLRAVEAGHRPHDGHEDELHETGGGNEKR